MHRVHPWDALQAGRVVLHVCASWLRRLIRWNYGNRLHRCVSGVNRGVRLVLLLHVKPSRYLCVKRRVFMHHMQTRDVHHDRRGFGMHLLHRPLQFLVQPGHPVVLPGRHAERHGDVHALADHNVGRGGVGLQPLGRLGAVRAQVCKQTAVRGPPRVSKWGGGADQRGGRRPQFRQLRDRPATHPRLHNRRVSRRQQPAPPGDDLRAGAERCGDRTCGFVFTRVCGPRVASVWPQRWHVHPAVRLVCAQRVQVCVRAGRALHVQQPVAEHHFIQLVRRRVVLRPPHLQCQQHVLLPVQRHGVEH